MANLEEFTISFPGSAFELSGYTAVNGVTWFQAKSVCDGLGFTNPTRVVRAYCCPEDTLEVTYGRGRPQTFITESAVYDLVLESKTIESRALRKWLTREVLPAIRRDGGYIDPNASRKQLDRLTLRIEELKSAVDSIPKRDPEETPGDAALDGLAAPILAFSIYGGFDPSDVARSVKRRINQICTFEFPGLSDHSAFNDRPIKSTKGHQSTALG